MLDNMVKKTVVVQKKLF